MRMVLLCKMHKLQIAFVRSSHVYGGGRGEVNGFIHDGPGVLVEL